MIIDYLINSLHSNTRVREGEREREREGERERGRGRERGEEREREGERERERERECVYCVLDCLVLYNCILFTSFMTHDPEKGIAWNNGMGGSSDFTGNASVKTVERKYVKQLNARPLNSIN